MTSRKISSSLFLEPTKIGAENDQLVHEHYLCKLGLSRHDPVSGQFLYQKSSVTWPYAVGSILDRTLSNCKYVLWYG